MNSSFQIMKSVKVKKKFGGGCISFISDVNSNCFVSASEIFFKKLNIIVIEGVREGVELELGKRMSEEKWKLKEDEMGQFGILNF